MLHTKIFSITRRTRIWSLFCVQVKWGPAGSGRRRNNDYSLPSPLRKGQASLDFRVLCTWNIYYVEMASTFVDLCYFEIYSLHACIEVSRILTPLQLACSLQQSSWNGNNRKDSIVHGNQNYVNNPKSHCTTKVIYTGSIERKIGRIYAKQHKLYLKFSYFGMETTQFFKNIS